MIISASDSGIAAVDISLLESRRSQWTRTYRMVFGMNRGMSAYLEAAIVNEPLSGHPKLVMAQYMMEPSHEIFRRKS